MIELEGVSDLVDPIVIAAFEGWNDAADAASSTVDHLMKVWSARVVGVIDPEDYYDFQVNRPTVGVDDNGHRRVSWPSTQIAIASPPTLDRDIILLRGIEPNMRWRRFCDELLAACDRILVMSDGRVVRDIARHELDDPENPDPVDALQHAEQKLNQAMQEARGGPDR